MVMVHEEARGLGRIYEPDERDRRFLMRHALAEPVLADHRIYRRGPILDQGNSGTCVAHAWRAWQDGEPLMSRPTTGPRPFDLYDKCIVVDQWADNDHDIERQMGTSVRAGAQVLSELGHVGSYLWAFNVDDVRRWMLSGQGGIVFGVNWYRDLGRPNEEGIIHAAGPMDGGPAIYCFGIDDRAGMVYLQNSWGEGWGGWLNPRFKNQRVYRGCARLPYEDLERLLREQGEACTAVQSRVEPLEHAPTL
jgi:hypothetical protein